MPNRSTLPLKLASILVALVFAAPSAMAGDVIAHDPPHQVSVGGASAGPFGGTGEHQSIMNDDYYHAPQAADPGHKVTVFSAEDKPLDTSSYVAKDPGHKLNVLTATDEHGRLIRIPIWAHDVGAKRLRELRHATAYQWATCSKNGQYNCVLPTCGQEAPGYTDDCVPTDRPYDCYFKDLTGLPCPKYDS